ncbi:MAG: NAD-dependent epimerase/dehydratase family protein [Acidobacteria bacterium]|nr:NAD-dependent epimerase/dehydratase family protein [Acidobacteriota bacterium]
MQKLLVTGSNGLVGSTVVEYFDALGWRTYGIDNNMRKEFFGTNADTGWMLSKLQTKCKRFTYFNFDIRDRKMVEECLVEVRPDMIVHAAAQPSHDLAASRPFDDFEINALSTLILLEFTRRHAPEATFVYMSSNKVYGDAPNELAMQELEYRWDYALPDYYDGISESFRIDRSQHSIFGASKVAADVMVQEYGRYFGLRTCCLRAGCITGTGHSAVELHGFLSYLTRVAIMNETYRIFGYKGKQVRDNIDSYDIATFIEQFHDNPQIGEVYNIGGGRENSCSIMEAFGYIEHLTGTKVKYEYIEQVRRGDHICYISDLKKARLNYPGWNITKNLPTIFENLVDSWKQKLN